MASETDELLTVFRIVGEQEAVSAYQRVAAASGQLSTQTAGLRSAQQQAAIGFGVSSAALAFFGKSAMAAADDSVVFRRAAGNFKGAFPQADLESWTAGLQDLTGIDDDRIAGIAGVLGTFQLAPIDAKALTLPILNASESLKALGLTAEGVSGMVGKAIQTGQATSLRRAGIVIDTDSFAAAATQGERVRLVIAALQAQGGDAAITFRDSLPGAFQAFNTEVHTAEEGIGGGLLPILRGVSEAGISVIHTFNTIPGPVKAAVGIIGGAAAVVGTVYTGATVLALNNTIRLAEAHLLAARGAGAQAASEDRLAGSLGRVSLAGRAAGAAGAGAGISTAFTGATSTAGTTTTPGGAQTAGGLRGFLGSNAGKAAGIAGIASLGLSLIPETGNRGFDTGKDVLAGTLSGAGTGAALGSFVGPEGTLIGGAIGGVIGGGVAFATDQAKANEGKKQASGGGDSAALAAAQEQNRLLQQQLDELRAIRNQGAIPFSDLSARDQLSSLFD